MDRRVASLGVALAAFLVRFLRLGAIENDHYVYLARAHQVLHGSWPVRDFTDPGMPLAYLLSAAAAAVGGPSLLTEAVLAVGLFAIGVGLAFALACRASGRTAVGLAVAAFLVLLPPRLYNSSKMLVPLAATRLAWWYADRPSGRRAAALGAWTGIAFLIRHDYAVYLGAAAALLLLRCLWTDRSRLFAHAASAAAAALAVAGPWLAYVQWQQGVPEYLASALRFSAAEASRTASHWPLAFYLVAAIPIVVLSAGYRGTRTLGSGHVVFATLALLLSDLVLLRDEPAARLPDVYAMTGVVAAILVGRLAPPRMPATARPSRAAATTALAALAACIVLLAWPGAPLPARLNVGARWHLVATRLHEARPDIMPVPQRAELVAYLARCTGPEERILIGGFGPELPVLAHRAFAAGMPDWIPGYYEHPDDVRRARRQLAREPVAVAVLLEGGPAFAASWPLLAEDLRARGLVPHVLQLPSERVELWIRPATRTDDATGLPCRS